MKREVAHRKMGSSWVGPNSSVLPGPRACPLHLDDDWRAELAEVVLLDQFGVSRSSHERVQEE